MTMFTEEEQIKLNEISGPDAWKLVVDMLTLAASAFESADTAKKNGAICAFRDRGCILVGSAIAVGRMLNVRADGMSADSFWPIIAARNILSGSNVEWVHWGIATFGMLADMSDVDVLNAFEKWNQE